MNPVMDGKGRKISQLPPQMAVVEQCATRVSAWGTSDTPTTPTGTPVLNRPDPSRACSATEPISLCKPFAVQVHPLGGIVYSLHS